jgi:secreted PhoX family phosphatase
MRYFTVSEAFGPFKKCACGNESWGTLLTDEENKRLPVESGSEAVLFIMRHRLGEDMCLSCACKKFKEKS